MQMQMQMQMTMQMTMFERFAVERLAVRPAVASLCFLLLLAGCTPVSAPPMVSEPYEPLPPIQPGPEDWPWWRGPARDGKALGAAPPVSWARDERVRWQMPIAGRGHSSPCVWEDRIFLTTAKPETEEQILVCFSRDGENLLWVRILHSGGFPAMHRKNSHASASPACDGERVFSAFVNHDGLHVSATDLEGDLLWQTSAGPFVSQHGFGASPVVWGSLVIVNGDSDGVGYVAALHRATGKVVWRTPRSGTPSYATPIAGVVAGKPQLLLHGGNEVWSYDPETGAPIWHARGPSEVTAGTMAFGEDLVYASGGYPEKEILCIRADGSGDVTDSRIVWRATRGVAYVPSPLLHTGRLFVVDDGGVVTCFAAATGEVIWRERLRGSFSASPTVAGENIYAVNEDGTTFVFKAADRFELLAENELGAGGFASPVICGGRIYLRSSDTLYCIGEG
jgi:hypothetical protein